MELVGGHYAELHGSDNLTYHLIATLEESLEMAGVITFIWALLVYIADHYGDLRLRVEGGRQAAALDRPVRVQATGA